MFQPMEFKMATRLLVLLTAATLTTANTGALVRSELGQPLTSSTLQWVSIDGHRTAIPHDAVLGGHVNREKSYICRTRQSNLQEIGTSDGVICRIISYGRIVDEPTFQILVNSNHAGRVIWSAWDRSQTSFFRAVQNGNYFIGRRLGPNGNSYVGHLDPNRRGTIYTIDEQDQIHESSQGETICFLISQLTSLHIALQHSYFSASKSSSSVFSINIMTYSFIIMNSHLSVVFRKNYSNSHWMLNAGKAMLDKTPTVKRSF